MDSVPSAKFTDRLKDGVKVLKFGHRGYPHIIDLKLIETKLGRTSENYRQTLQWFSKTISVKFGHTNESKESH